MVALLASEPQAEGRTLYRICSTGHKGHAVNLSINGDLRTSAWRRAAGAQRRHVVPVNVRNEAFGYGLDAWGTIVNVKRGVRLH